MSQPVLMKDKLALSAVLEISDVLSYVITDFPAERFISDASEKLEQLELKQRVDHIVKVLSGYLPNDFNDAAPLLLQVKSYWSEQVNQSGWNSFPAWPLIDYVGVYGLHEPDLALEVLEQLTSLFSAEFAIRAFINSHFEKTYQRLLVWTQHDDPHVRRLASEGCRPRLPWASQLKELRRDPTPIFAILEQLKDDPSLYVRKSVANNLNDIAKDHPHKVMVLCQHWKSSATKQRLWIIKHALRSLIKEGNAAAFEILNYSSEPQITGLTFKLTPDLLSLDQTMELSVSLQSTSSDVQTLMLDYKVFHVKANGQRIGKVFKWKTIQLAPMQQLDMVKKHVFKRLSTRRYYAGQHRVEIVINGQSMAQAECMLSL